MHSNLAKREDLLQLRDFVQNCKDIEVGRDSLLQNARDWNPRPKGQLEHG
jgi:hypothetical protein